MDINLIDYKLYLDCRVVVNNTVKYIYIYFTNGSETRILKAKDFFNIIGAEW